MISFLNFLIFSIIPFIDCKGGGILDIAGAIKEIVHKMNQEYKVMVVNNCSNSIYLKCASADDAIDGKGSNKDDWWTLKSGEALAWGFAMNWESTTCFWCYWNNNGHHARKTGNWYIHQNVWGYADHGCEGAPARIHPNHGVTEWQVRNTGAYSNMCEDCNGGAKYERYASWGPAP